MPSGKIVALVNDKSLQKRLIAITYKDDTIAIEVLKTFGNQP